MFHDGCCPRQSVSSAARNAEVESINLCMTTAPRRHDVCLSQRAGCQIDGVTALHAACMGGHDDVVQTLLANGANVNQAAKVRAL